MDTCSGRLDTAKEVIPATLFLAEFVVMTV